eukprot:TRINITY_DN3047_c0_g1_i13.p1 TRINITY_DN3047_c0_g1~~TRINITY_DN3047_c0_g1_i13.p1  ORF type:complete len:476 (-),score=92.45 TRINITY_DN3047_c0_g1_i13:1633-3060(-)
MCIRDRIGGGESEVTTSSLQHFKMDDRDIVFNDDRDNGENTMSIVPDWMKRVPNHKYSRSIYFENLIVGPIRISASFKRKVVDMEKDYTKEVNPVGIFRRILSAIGIAVVNIEGAEIQIMTPRVVNGFDTVTGFIDKLKRDYISQAKKSIFSVLGAINIFGNPVYYFRRVSEETTEVMERLAKKDEHGESMMYGPLEQGLGVIKGSEIAVRETILGGFHTINHITDSLASGLSILTMDEEYMFEREQLIMKRPRDLGDGIFDGAYSLYLGVEKGIKGVFTMPYEGAQREGVLGFCKGALRGLAGLVIKPVTGLLDATTKTAAGLNNTGEIPLTNESRLRYPRPFYGDEKFFRIYDSVDAETAWLLQNTAAGKYASSGLLCAFLIKEDEHHWHQHFLVALTESLVFANRYYKKIEWSLDMKNLREVSRTEEGIFIRSHQPVKEFNKRNVIVVKSENVALNEEIVDTLRDIIEAREL